uniref:DoxX family protein n=1 Tax=Strombidinopsis acuminata TaxID=141414 RepID=A0A7S3U8U1_9SPIT|mmetsp:Transcript_36351/g.93721  ORF Transcript_36351/g.93721 Transcript_36351/m.93721 type:complete len:150 (-) Transcript_36351:252-701(-)
MIGALCRFLGRACFAAIFLASAAHHATNIPEMAGMIHKDFPAELVGGLENAAKIAVGLMGLGGLLIATGFAPRLGSLLCAAFLVPATYFQHVLAMQAATDEKTKKTEMIMVLKNVAIFGALVMLFGYECGRTAPTAPAPSGGKKGKKQS